MITRIWICSLVIALGALAQDDGIKHWEIAQKAYQSKNYEVALEHFLLARDIMENQLGPPPDTGFLYSLAVCQFATSRMDEAAQTVEEIVENNKRMGQPANIFALVLFFEIKVATKHWEAARLVLAEIKKNVETARVENNDTTSNGEQQSRQWHEWISEREQRFEKTLYSEFSMIDLKNASALLSRLKASSDEISRYILGRLGASTRDELARWKEESPPSPRLLLGVLEDLNIILIGDSIWDSGRFEGIEVRPKTEELRKLNPSGQRRVRLNRLLLEDAFPNELLKSPELEPR